MTPGIDEQTFLANIINNYSISDEIIMLSINFMNSSQFFIPYNNVVVIYVFIFNNSY